MKIRNVILLVIVFLILLGISIFWYFYLAPKAHAPFVENNSPKATTTSTSSEFVSTKNWKTYTDTKRGFSITYPSDDIEPDDEGEPAGLVFRLKKGRMPDSVFSVWRYPTKTSDIHAWIRNREKVMGTTTSDTAIIGTSTIDKTNVLITENKYIYGYSFIDQGRVWVLSFGKRYLTKRDIKLIFQSFQITSG